MLGRLRGSGAGRRLRAVGSGLVDTFLRDNRVVPAVLAVLALFIFAWIVAGAFVGGPEDEPVSNRANVARPKPEVAQAEGGSPEIESRDVDSYAAYQSKDPFRQLLAPASEQTTTPESTGATTGNEDTTGAGTDTGNTTGSGTGGNGAGGGGGGARRFSDADNDGLSNRRERRLGTDPQNPDSDNDGTRDGADDANGDGVPDGRAGGSGRGGGGSGGTGGGAGGGERTDRSDGLFDSGGNLYGPAP